MEGWICPKCRRALAPWISECPCYLTDTQITCTQTGTTTVKPLTNYGDKMCDKICIHKTDLGFCRYTACINPNYGGNPDYGIGNGA